jgi:hypothetical protein
MWIFTETGFVSAVRKEDNPSLLTVRARDRKSLELLSEATGAKIAQSPDADYPYRLFVSAEAFGQWAMDQAINVDYSNFKNRVAKTRGYEFASSLGGVWLAMLGVEDDAARHNETTVIADV